MESVKNEVRNLLVVTRRAKIEPFAHAIGTGWRHFLQTDDWEAIKKTTRWSVRRLATSAGHVFVYGRTVVGLGRVHYIPKVSGIDESVVSEWTKYVRDNIRSGLCLKMEIDQPFSQSLHDEMIAQGWEKGASIQYDETVTVDLTPPVEDIFKSFKKRARWELNAAMRRGAIVERVACTPQNMGTLFAMLRITSERGNFSIRNRKFLEKYWRHFSERGNGYLYLVRHDYDILSAAYVIKIGNRAYYKDGASVRQKQNLFASRLMQWTIMKDMKALGADTYDMCGVMNSKSTDEKNKGIRTFKTAFADATVLQGAYTLPLGTVYPVWNKIERHYIYVYFKLMRDLWY